MADNWKPELPDEPVGVIPNPRVVIQLSIALLILVLGVGIMLTFRAKEEMNMQDPSASSGNPPPVETEPEKQAGSTPPVIDEEKPEGSIPSHSPAGLESMINQFRSLSEVAGFVSDFHGQTGYYPETFGEVLETVSPAMPENHLTGEGSLFEVFPGDFSAGGFSYLPYTEDDGESISGFIIIGYARTIEDGYTIENPGETVEPYSLYHPVTYILRGVTAVMHEDGGLTDITEYPKSTNVESEE